ncbi:MAG: amino acid permease [Sandaracinaceae bacterium]
MSKQAEASKAPVKFGTFTGVFTPTLLTILGVIMFVRLPWVVGNGGILGAFAVLGLAMGITICTGLSLSSIATNTRVGAGGPYAMISRSLGLEVGGSIGVPLYLSRPLGIAMYVFGFREGVQWIVGSQDPLLALGIDMAVFVALFGLSYLSADLAFRVQYLIMAVIVVAIASVIATPRLFEPQGELSLLGSWRGFPEDDFAGTDFWVVFAVFFPATTGILAGANMSGDLEDPRRSISRGTLWAIVISCVIYFGLAVWASFIGTEEELLTNYNFFIDHSYFSWGVLAGLLGATFSSALASAVGGPRILMAMGQNQIMPKSDWWAKTSDKGEPRNAIVLTAILTFGCLMMRDLNAIAPLVTMFFLITYLMINVVLLVESSLGLVSFRPSLRVPRLVPLLGAIGCIFTMFIVNPIFGLIAVGTSVAIYVWISRLGVGGRVDDVRSSFFESVAEWAASKVVQLGGTNVRSWKPEILVPVQNVAEVRGNFRFLAEIARPEGTVNLLGLSAPESDHGLRDDVERIGRDFRDKDVLSRWSVVNCAGQYCDGVTHGLQALQGAFFQPNMLFLELPTDPARHDETRQMVVEAHDTGVGVLLFGEHPDAKLGQKAAIDLWLRPDRSGWGVDEAFASNNLDLTLLMGYRLMRSWGAELRVRTAVENEDECAEAKRFLDEICDLARLPENTEREVVVSSFRDALRRSPQSDLHIMGLPAQPDFELLTDFIDAGGASCLFVADSGRESARA